MDQLPIKFSLVIPCFNEANNLPSLVEKFNQHKKSNTFELILVDNGSTDSTWEIISDLSTKFIFIKAIHLNQNEGYGNGILKGLEKAKGDYLGWAHGDNQTDAMDILKCINTKMNESSFIKGKRVNRRNIDKFFSSTMAFVLSILFGYKLEEITAQPTIFHKNFLNSWKSPPKDFSLDLYALLMAKKLHLKMERINVNYLPRMYGESSWKKGLLARPRLILRTISYSIRLKLTQL